MPSPLSQPQTSWLHSCMLTSSIHQNCGPGKARLTLTRILKIPWQDPLFTLTAGHELCFACNPLPPWSPLLLGLSIAGAGGGGIHPVLIELWEPKFTKLKWLQGPHLHRCGAGQDQPAVEDRSHHSRAGRGDPCAGGRAGAAFVAEGTHEQEGGQCNLRRFFLSIHAL